MGFLRSVLCFGGAEPESSGSEPQARGGLLYSAQSLEPQPHPPPPPPPVLKVPPVSPTDAGTLAARRHAAGEARSWNMHVDVPCPLFADYLELADKADWGALLIKDEVVLGKEDALIVVDMQADFIPVDDANPDGGAFAVAEGNAICNLIAQLTESFTHAGGVVVATRDYHPDGHCSFLSKGGPFPDHCVQGSPGTFFYPTVGKCLYEQRKVPGRRVEIAFKGYHEAVDSFGGFTYPQHNDTWERVNNNKSIKKLFGCSCLSSWTGSDILHCSNLKRDINAPPDILAAHDRETLADYLKNQGIKRVFACGLALDFCVLDTALNGVVAGFNDVSIILDAARAAHLPGIGPIGTGFLSPHDGIYKKMVDRRVAFRPASAFIRMLNPQCPFALKHEVFKPFPEKLGPFALFDVVPEWLRLKCDFTKLTYSIVEPEELLAELKDQELDSFGKIGPPSDLSLDRDALRQMGVPDEATKYCFAYCVGGGNFTDQQRGYFSTTHPPAAFLILGGFVYFNAAGDVVSAKALTAGRTGLSFAEPEAWAAKYSQVLEARWQPVTFPFLRCRGVRRFCWINPQETIKDGKDEVLAGGPHGAFVYLFHEALAESDPRDRIFRVSGILTSAEHAPIVPGLGKIGTILRATTRPRSAPPHQSA